MAADDKFIKAGYGTATTLSAPGYTSGVSTTINVASTATWPTTTDVIFAIDEAEVVDGEEQRVDGTYNVFQGTVDTATSIIDVDYIGGDAERSYSAGALTRVYILSSSYLHNRTIDGILVEHTQTGAHEADFLIPSYIDNTYLSGWIDPSESWAYASWTSGTRTGTITVPTDATTRFSAGMKIRISQSTGGTKYGIITKVDATVLTVYFGNDYTLNNEAISNPHYSIQHSPFGFPKDPTKWTQKYAYVDDFSTTSATYAQVGAHQLSVPIGSWRLRMKATGRINLAGVNICVGFIGLSTATSSASDLELVCALSNPTVSSISSQVQGPMDVEKIVTVTSATTYYQVFSRANALTFDCIGSEIPGYIEAVSAYL